MGTGRADTPIMTSLRNGLRGARPDERGFTLVELLVVMIVVGILAGIAVPAFMLQRRKAYEASAKSDVKAITKEVTALFVDGSGSLTISGSNGTWTIEQNGVPAATGELSPGNSISPASFITVGGEYCLSIRNSLVDAQFWAADDVGLRAGDCTPTS